MLNKEPFVGSKTEILKPKKLPIKANTYIKKIPPVAAKTPSLKFSVTSIKPDLYTTNRDIKIDTVIIIAFKTIPSNI